VFSQLNAGVVTRHYTTTVTLTAGRTYAFKVKARNTVGLSLYSEPISILAAHEPDAPLNLANVPATYSFDGQQVGGITTAYQVGLTWTEGDYNGGTSVIDFRVSFKEQSAADYTIFADLHTSTAITVDGLTPGDIYDFAIQARNVIKTSLMSAVLTVKAA
jgi:hypothetical protein